MYVCMHVCMCTLHNIVTYYYYYYYTMYIYVYCVHVYVIHAYVGRVVPHTRAAAVIACDKEVWDRG